MAIKIHPDGGFILTKDIPGGEICTRLSWRKHNTKGIAIEIIGEEDGTSLVALLTNILGDGLRVEFDQLLLHAAPGCGPSVLPRSQIAVHPLAGERDEAAQRWASLSGEVLDMAVQLGVPVDGVPLGDVLASMKQVIGQAQAAELRPLDDKGPTSPFKDEPQPTSSDPLLSETKPATIAGVPVAEAQPEQPRRKRRTREQILADEAAAAAAKQAAQQPAVVPAQPTASDPVATAAFQADMAALSGKIDELPKASLVQVKPPAAAAQQPEQRVEPTGDPLDEMVDLLSNPPMPVDLHPLDSKRNPSDTQLLDTAHIRLYYGYPLVEEYAKDPKFKPGNPPAPGVNLRTDEGVVAAVQWLAKIHERAGQRGVAIPQLDLFFGLGELPEVIEASVLKVRARREAQAAALAGRR